MRIESKALPGDIRSRALADLTAINVDKERALAEKIRGADYIPDYLELFTEKRGEIIFPRGFAHRLEQIAQECGEEIEWESDMTLLPPSQHLFRDWPAAQLYDDQILARDAALDWAQGLVQAPTGSGKTRAALEFIRWAGQKTVVIVGKAALARQWQEAAREVYGYETGYIGEGTFEVKDLTVALWQTLWARRDDLWPGFWAQFGAVVGDEVHHAGAHSLAQLMSEFPAFYRIGFSATPRWDDSSWPVVKALFGPVIHKTEHGDVGDRLVTPSVVIVPTDFEAEYVPTHYEGRKRVQNNYTEIMAALVADARRNDLIAQIARKEAQEGHHVLIVTRRVEHVKQLIARLEKVLRVGTRLHGLTGEQTGHDAQRIAKAIDAAEGGTVLVSTVAEEALDIPRLDRLVMGFPIKKLPLIEQQIGRIMRQEASKEDAVIYDVVDDGVGPLLRQRMAREKLYARRRWSVSTYEREELHAV